MLGKLTKVKVVKNKVAPPFNRAEFDIMFGEGISRSGEIIDLGVELGIIKKSGSWFSFIDSKLAQGRDAAKRVIQDNPELADELEGLIMEALKNQDNRNGKKEAPKKKDKETPTSADDADEPTAADLKAVDDSLFDDEDLPDDFSIEEDI